MSKAKKGVRDKVRLIQIGATPPPMFSAPPIMASPDSAPPEAENLDQLGYVDGQAPPPPGAPEPMQPGQGLQDAPPPPQQQAPPPQPPPQQEAPPPPDPNAQLVGAAPGGASAAPSQGQQQQAPPPPQGQQQPGVGSGSPGGNGPANLSDTPQTRAAMQQIQAALDPAQSGDRAIDAVKLASFLPLLSMLTGGSASYGSQLVAPVASNIIAGQNQHDEQQQQRAAQQAELQFKNQQAERERNVAEMNARTAETKEKNAVIAAQQKYDLDIAEFRRAVRKDDLDNNNNIAKVRGEYADRMAKLTPESQAGFFQSLDPAFKAYYGITLPKGGFEQQNPNAPTEDMQLQKDLSAQYDLLKRDPKYLNPAAQKQIVKRIAELQNALGMGSDAQLPPEVFANIDPATAQNLRIKVQAEIRAQRAQKSTEIHQRAGESHDKAMERIAWANAEIGRENARLRAEEMRLRAEMLKTTKAKDPLTTYQKLTDFVQGLQKQKTALTQGNYNPLTGEYQPPDPAKLKQNAETMAWVESQLQTYTALANNVGSALGIPPTNPDGSPMQPQQGQQGQQGGYAMPPQMTAPPMAPQQQPAPTQRATGTGQPKAKAAPAGNVDQAVALLTQAATNAQALKAELARRKKARTGQ